MLTDAPFRKNRAEFLDSDRVKSLDVPQNGMLLEIAKRLDSAMKSERIVDVRRACAEFLATAPGFYRVSTCLVRVLAAISPACLNQAGRWWQITSAIIRNPALQEWDGEPGRASRAPPKP